MPERMWSVRVISGRTEAKGFKALVETKSHTSTIQLEKPVTRACTFVGSAAMLYAQEESAHVIQQIHTVMGFCFRTVETKSPTVGPCPISGGAW